MSLIVRIEHITVQSAGHVHSVVITIAILLWIVLGLKMQDISIHFSYGWLLVSYHKKLVTSLLVTDLGDKNVINTPRNNQKPRYEVQNSNLWPPMSCRLGSIYVNIINLDFLIRLAAKTSIKSLISFFVPLVAWALGIVDEDFYDATLSMISLFVLAISIFYLKVKLHVILMPVLHYFWPWNDPKWPLDR